jgi:hypothetical protein
MTRRTASIQERQRVRNTREKARRAVSYWSEGWFGAQTAVLQERIGRVIGKDLDDVVQRYPLAVRRAGRKQLWDMTVLEGSLRFDDPATMLGNLAASNPEAWLALLQKEGEEGCSTAEENDMRTALMRMMVPIGSCADPAADPWAAGWALYRENLLSRKS